MAVNINVPSQVKTYANLAAFPASGALKTIYIAEDTNKTYRWTGSVYVEVSAAGATGITIGTTAITSGTVGRVLFEGTGNVVSQSANLFWDATNNRLGVGTSSTSGRLSVLGTSTTVPNNATWISAGNPIASLFGEGIGGNMDLFIGGASSVSSARPVLTGRKSAGTLASPTALSNGDNIFSFLSGGYSGTSFVNTGSINMIVDGVVSSGTVPQAITFETGTSSRAERLRIGSNGNVLINTTTDAGFKLDVNGTARLSGNLTLGAEIFGTTNTYFNGPTLNTGTLRLRFGSVFSNGAFTVDGPVQGTNVIASGTNNQLSSTGSGVQGVLISNTATSTTWRIEGHRTTSGALEFKNDITNPVLNLFSTRNVGIGTFTDAGFKLDVNGTARVKDAGSELAT